MKILVIGPSWVGDMMMSQSLYRLLAQRHPGVQIDVMASAWCSPLLNRMPEVISQTLSMPFGHGALALNERRRLGQSLRQSGYQQALILPNSIKSTLVPFFADIPQRTGWRGEMRYGLLNDLRTLDKQAFPLMVQRYSALAFDHQTMRSAADLPAPLPWPHLTVSAAEKTQALSTFVPNDARPLIGFCHGAEFGPAKRWPHYYYSALAEALIHRGYQIALFGSHKDYAVGKAINSAITANARSYCYNLAGQTSLEQAIMLIAACQGIVSNDSGLMHVASALNRPLVALYGPSSPDFTPPLSHQARVIRLINGYQKIRKSNDEQGYHQSLIAIQPTMVLSELESLLLSNRRINASPYRQNILDG